MNKNKGFSLLELLVIVAIIGLIATVVFSALGSARTKSNDAAIKSALTQVANQADIYFASVGSYINVCSTASNNSDPKGVNGMILRASKSLQAVEVNVNGNGGAVEVRCNDDPLSSGGFGRAWAAQIPLSDGKYFCMDSNRKGLITATSISGNNSFCN